MPSAKRFVPARLQVILGALAFGASVPAGKLLLRGHSPMAVSGGLYLAAGMTCGLLLLIDSRNGVRTDNCLQGRDWWWLAGAVALGGVLAPLALFYGLQWTSGYAAGLLLNFEAVFTVAVAALFFGDRVGKRGALGIALTIAGAIALSSLGSSPTGTTRTWGALLVVVACACWALDNNFTQRISLNDARQIVAIKGLVGGTVNLGLAALFGQLGTWSPGSILVVFLVGAISYGLSIVLFIRGLRELGALQTGALFALAPGFAAVLSWAVLHEPVTPPSVLALLCMTAGAIYLSTDVHEHAHRHAAIEHAHVHEHDEHHQHEHTPEELAQVPHAHRHRHPEMRHAHAHTHGAHHQHAH